MNIPNDGGWGKSAGREGTAHLGHGYGLPEPVSALWNKLPRDWLLLGCLVLTGTFCFGLGLLAARENAPPKDPLWIEQLPPEELPGSIGPSTPAGQIAPMPQEKAKTRNSVSHPSPVAPDAQTGNYVASKTGSKYYLPSCAAAKRIKDENKVWFATKELAAAAGYQPATNCKGL